MISLEHYNQHIIIALQPLGPYNDYELTILRGQLSSFFKIQVIILDPMEIPHQFRDSVQDRYSADSLVKFLSRFQNDTIINVVGVTHKKIYTIEEKVEEKNKPSNQKSSKLIFGLGLVSGNSSIVSDYRLMSTDRNLYNNRLRKVIIHEIGHNLGLTHCTNTTCLMSETNGDLINLNKLGGDFCATCRKKLD